MNLSYNLSIGISSLSESDASHSNQDLIKNALQNIICPQQEHYHYGNQSSVESTGKKTLEWASKFKIIDENNEEILKKLAASRFTSLMAGIHPFSKANKFRFISDWITMLFFLDDKNEELSIPDLERFNQRNIEVLRKDSDLTEQDEPLTRAIHNLSNRIHKFALLQTNWNKEIFYQDMGNYLNSIVEELHNRDEKKIPSLEEYKPMRRLTGAGDVMFNLMLIIEDINLTRETLDHPLLTSMREACNNILGWLNDIVSFPKESKGECFMNNIISVIKNEYNYNDKDAIDEAVRLHNEEMEKFLKLREEVPRSFKDSSDQIQQEVARYVEGLCRWIESHCVWLSETKRYS